YSERQHTELRCPLCFEQLDVSSNVLPCQHTFCVSCLQRHEAAHFQLFCPECRAPVPDRTAGELPTNSPPVRLPQGPHGSPRPSRDKQKVRYAVPVPRPGMTVNEGLQLQQEMETQRGRVIELLPYESHARFPEVTNPSFNIRSWKKYSDLTLHESCNTTANKVFILFNGIFHHKQ
uniref:RING-type domain-containing protein n=1 Tax=Mola mola TaxID=94237 RepID=A0A3Q4AMJ7_MOLML